MLTAGQVVTWPMGTGRYDGLRVGVVRGVQRITNRPIRVDIDAVVYSAFGRVLQPTSVRAADRLTVTRLTEAEMIQRFDVMTRTANDG